MIGVLAAQSIEGFTQATLNIFHYAGLSEKNSTLGLSRLEELLNATKEPKVIGFTFFPRKKYPDLDALRIQIRLPEVCLGQLVQRTQFDPVASLTYEAWYDKYKFLYGSDYLANDWRIRLFLRPEQLFRLQLTLAEIAATVEKTFENIIAVPSPLSEGILDLYLQTGEISGDEKTSDLEAQQSYLRDIVLREVKSLYITGIPGVEAVYPKEVSGSWIFEGNGGNLLDLLAHPEADTRTTLNDNIWDIYQCLGIEAVRAFLIEEITRVMSFDGTYVNPKHIRLLADRMCLDGTISAVNRHGMSREQYGPLTKACFEETVGNVIRSGIHGESDNLHGVSAAIVTGKAPRIGGGMVQVRVDLSKLESIPETPEYLEF